MAFKQNWSENLSSLRKKEVELVRQALRDFNMAGERALELGAGDGFQASLLAPSFQHYTYTDLNDARLGTIARKNAARVVVDAERIGHTFPCNTFDFVFSSNLLEHLPRVDDCLNGLHSVLRDDGHMVHIVPNSYWRIFSILAFPLNKLDALINRVLSPNSNDTQKPLNQNNLKSPKRPLGKVASVTRKLLPQPHGVSRNAILEIFDLRQHVWVEKFHQNGFEVLELRKGPISSGYGFGLQRVKRWAARVGFSTETIYVVRKTHQATPANI